MEENLELARQQERKYEIQESEYAVNINLFYI